MNNENKSCNRRKKSRKELENIINEIHKATSEIRVLAGNLEAKKRAELEKNVSELQKKNMALSNRIKSLENNFAVETKRTNDLVATIKQLVSANNAASMVINCMESWFDSKHKGWDEGAREKAEKKTKLLKERASIASIVHQNKETDIEKLNKLADRMLEIATELETDVIDLPMILSIYLKSKNIDKAETLIAKVRDCKLKLPKDTEFLVGKLEDEIKKCRNHDKESKMLKMPPVKDRRIITP
jgi:hypothetical protein